MKRTLLTLSSTAVVPARVNPAEPELARIEISRQDQVLPEWGIVRGRSVPYI